MKKRIIMFTGGQRSGKSELAERKALELSPEPVYLATARVWDAEMARRVEAHKARRGPQWTSVEEPMHLSRHPMEGRTVLVDCLTLWATNVFFAEDEDDRRALDFIARELEDFTRPEAQYIFVTNEIGLGGVSENAMRRRFTDLQGSVNRLVAEMADEVYLVVSGIPVRIK